MSERAHKHTLIEDLQGLVFGALMCGFGLTILTGAGLVTGQTAGLAVLIGYATGWGFGAVFFAINLPFYLLAWRRLGPVFTFKTFLSVGLVALFASFMPDYIHLETLNPAIAAILFGAVTGAGLLAIFRHGASLGGVGIVAYDLQERLGWRAGWVQLGFDFLLFTFALLLMPLDLIAYSLLGAVVVNVILGVNHRRDRYIAT